MRHFLPLVFLFTFLWAVSSAQELQTSRTCHVFVNDQEIESVYDTAVCHQRYWTAEPVLSSTPVAVTDCIFPCNVTVVFEHEVIQSAVVRPLSQKIVPEILEGEVSFTVNQPSQLTLEYNGGTEGALHLFLDTSDPDKPEADAPKVRYFGPGVYRDQIITVKSNETIYLDEGCILYGQIYSGMAQHFTIAGHGILCGSIYDRYEDTLPPVNLSNCSDFTIRDITILDPSAWTVNLYKCHDAHLENVKIISARSNSDGFTFQSCQNLLVQNCFVRSWDDSLVVKGYNGNASNITFDGCILWTDLAQSCEIGYETRAKAIENITFRNITVLHNFHEPVLSIHNSDHAIVRNVLFENIVVEDAQMGQGDGTPFLIDLSTAESQWSSTLRRGSIDGVCIRNVSVLSGIAPAIRIFSQDETSVINHVTISGLSYRGSPLLSMDDIIYESSEWNGPDISLIPSH